jgi:hypothetical protein
VNKTFWLFLFFSIAFFSLIFSMNYIIGLGYSPTRSWVYDLGAMNAFNDEITLRIFTPASTSQTNIYKINAMIPFLGRSDNKEGFRFGPTLETTISSSTSFSVGIYGQYYIGPWRLGAYVSKALKKNEFHTSFDIWYFFSSKTHNFIDYFVADVKVEDISSVSLIFIEPF